MTEPVQETTRWAYACDVPAALVEDVPMHAAVIARAVDAARREGLQAVGEPVIRFEPLSEVEVALAARIDTTDPASAWFGMPAVVIEAEVADRERAARNQRHALVEMDVVPLEEKPELRELAPWAAQAVAEQGLAVLAEQDANAAGLVCGEPRNRHDFLPRVAELLRDGRVQSAKCQKCKREVPRQELLDNAAAEARGERWWEQ